MSSTIQGLTGFDGDTIRVIVIANKRHKIITCPVKEQKAYLTKKVFIEFKTEDVGMCWTRNRRPPFRYDWFQAILWRQGSANAMVWDTKGDFLPLLTMDEYAAFIDRLVAAAKARDKKPIGDWQLALILILLIVIAAGVLLNLFGVHFGVSTAHQIVTTATPSPTPVVLP